MLDVLKEYLVDIGFNVDNDSLNKAKNSLSNAESAMNKFAGSTGSKLAGAGASVVAFIGTIDAAIAHMMVGLAKTDMEMQMFARLMWTSKENAMAFKTTLDAMGVSMQDLYVNPELMNKFIELRNEGLKMGPPAEEYAEQMRNIREFSYEMAKLKITATYALQWVAYYLTKYLDKPLKEVKQWFKDMNDKLITTMPQWTQRIAQFASWFIRLGEVIVKLPDAIKLLVVALTSWKTAAALIMNPLTWIITGITALLLLLDDFNTYKQGGESLFGDIWAAFEDDQISKSMQDIEKSLKEIVQSLFDIFKNIDWNDIIKNGLLVGLEALDRVLKSISELLKSIAGVFKGDFKDAMFGLSNSLRVAFGYEPLNPDDYEWKSGDQLKKETVGGLEWMFNESLMGNLRESTAGFRDWLWGTKEVDYWKDYNQRQGVQNNTFNIQSTDPQQAAGEVGRVLRSQTGW